MKPNPPIRGHELLSEGIVRRRYVAEVETYHGHEGGCRCGAKPEGFPDVSVYAMKRWHRLHKSDVRLALAQRGVWRPVDRSV